ncbi:MAG: hypothetical protein CME43_09945 [Haliea sp.]|jgi:hypothetical protein|uniref:hypothetical protein n=1 Tax=Haliea sp. TaxID=1932666 RepID=UPI000C6184FA|nr:hypothetical protein [Haliea sp.]MBM69785.1 hypothetical protein [Haliea sp.]|tara:strand:+ start:4216 stop:4503 length:288 start_codon:yes stop_codon:yes gene_type:complete
MRLPKPAALTLAFLLAPVFTAATLAQGEAVEDYPNDPSEAPPIGSQEYEANNPHLSVEDVTGGPASMQDSEFVNAPAGAPASELGLGEGAAAPSN